MPCTARAFLLIIRNPVQIHINIVLHVPVHDHINRGEGDEHHHGDSGQIDDQKPVPELIEHQPVTSNT
ncbi:hypothetical protein D3C86_2084980 [compost metagenome]